MPEATSPAEGLAGPGEIVAIATGMPPSGVAGSTNLLRIERLSTSRA